MKRLLVLTLSFLASSCSTSEGCRDDADCKAPRTCLAGRCGCAPSAPATLCAADTECGPRSIDSCGGRTLLFCSSCGAEPLPEDGVARCLWRADLADGGISEQVFRLDTVGFVWRQDGGMELNLPRLNEPLFLVTGAPGASALDVMPASRAQVSSWSKALRIGDFIGLDISASRDASGSELAATVRCVGRAAVSRAQSPATFCDGGCGNLTLPGIDGRYHDVSCGACVLSDLCVGVCGITCRFGNDWGSTTTHIEPLTLKANDGGYSASVGGGTLHTTSLQSAVVSYTFPIGQRGGGGGFGSATIEGGVITLSSTASYPLFYGSLVYGMRSATCSGSAHVVYEP